jgi:phenylacetate-CoA ligase
VVEQLEGRVDDYLVTADGRRIGRLSTVMKGSPSIHSAQIVQDRPGHAYLLVKPGQGYEGRDGLRIRTDLLSRIGPFDVDVIETPAIPRTPTGKTKLVVRVADRPELMPLYAGILPTEAAARPCALLS